MKLKGRNPGWPAAGLVLSLAVSTAMAAPLDGGDRRAAVQRGATEPLNQLEKDVEHAHPAAMFLLSKRLFDAGRKDEAAFWFFEAQVRWRPILSREDTAGHEQFRRLFAALDHDVNFYASCDLTKLLATYDKVLAWDASHPDDFTTDGSSKDKTRAEVKEIGDYAREHAQEMRKAHAGHAECAPAGGDPYDGGGGAAFGLPQELLTPYDPTRFSSFKTGATTRSQVVAAIGPPELWGQSDGKNGGSFLTYSYNLHTPAMDAIHMSRRVVVSFDFDSRKVLTKISLPDEKKLP